MMLGLLDHPGLPRGRAMCRLVALALAGSVVACSMQKAVWGGREPTRETLIVQERVTRWMATHYDPSGFLGDIEAICLIAADVAGGQLRAISMSVRDKEYDPSPALIARLRGTDPPVRPVSDCAQDAELVERVAATGGRGIVLAVRHPSWVTPNLARVGATVRENAQVRFTYNCSVERRPDGWRVRSCVRRI